MHYGRYNFFLAATDFTHNVLLGAHCVDLEEDCSDEGLIFDEDQLEEAQE